MCKLRHVLVMLVLTSGMLYAQPKLDMQNEVDWGTVTPTGPLSETQSVKYRVPVKNAGDSTLIISNVRVQCGCTTAPIEKDTLGPGEETAINISLNLPTGSGSLSKYVSIFSNDPSGAHVLRLKVEVQRPIQLATSFLAFDRVSVGNSSRALVGVTIFADTTVIITAASSTENVHVVTPMPLTLVKGQSAEIEFRYTPQKPGTFNIQAILNTTLPGYERIELSGYGSAFPAPTKP